MSSELASKVAVFADDIDLSAVRPSETYDHGRFNWCQLHSL